MGVESSNLKVKVEFGSDLQASMDAGVAEAIAQVHAAEAEAAAAAAASAGAAPAAPAPPSSAPTPPAHAEAPPPGQSPDDPARRAHWGLVQPLQFAALAGFGRDVARALTASSALAHDTDLLYALLVPSRPRALSPQVVYAAAVVPLLHAAAAMGREARVRELLGAAAGDAQLLQKRDAKGLTPVMAAAAAGEPRALAALLADARATRELVAAEGIDTHRVGGVALTAFVAACNASGEEAGFLHELESSARQEVSVALFAPRAAGAPAPDAGALMASSFKRLYAQMRKIRTMVGRRATAAGGAECARLLVAAGAVDPGFKTGHGSALQELAAAPARAAVIRGARVTQLAWAMNAPAVRAAVAEALLADPRCTRDAVAAHWLMLRKSAFWEAAEAFGECDSSDHGEPQPRFLAHDVEWWRSVLAGGAVARAALGADDRHRLDAHALLRLMTPFLRPDTVVLQRPTGPMYSSDGSDGPGINRTAQEVCDDLRLEEIAPIAWAPEAPAPAPAPAAQAAASVAASGSGGGGGGGGAM